MGYKMRGAPMMDTSKKHGTNSNYMKSGVTMAKNADGTDKPGPPIFGFIKKAAGRIHKGVGGLLGLGGKGGGGCPPAAPAAPAAPTSVAPPPEPAGGAASGTGMAQAPPPEATAEEPAGPAMHKNMKVGAPKYKKGAPKLKGGQHKIDMNKDGKLSKADFDMMNKKPGAPNYKKGYYGVK